MQGLQTSSAHDGAASATRPSPSAARSGSDAVAITYARCASCHSDDDALQVRASSAGETQSLIHAMVQPGATVSTTAQQMLIDHFMR